MRIPEKGKAVSYGFGVIAYSMGCTTDNGNLVVSFTNKCDIACDNCSVWQEVEITPVVHVPEDMKLCAVWQVNDKPKYPCFRLSAGKLNSEGHLQCYMDDGVSSLGNNENTAPWKHWEEV